ncbi:MAG: hypothetical protein K5866_08880 [Treponema sp.]|nr:hypothetical protein [Treponema sp.]
MKLDPVFYVKDNKLFKIQDNSLVDISSLKMIEIPWSTVELSEENYNEEYLAELREELKALDESNLFALLIPIVDKKLESPEDFELFTKAFNHTARRIKDCVSVAGYKLPEELVKKGFSQGSAACDFMETIAIKHAQYVNFVSKIDGVDFSNTEEKLVIL